MKKALKQIYKEEVYGIDSMKAIAWFLVASGKFCDIRKYQYVASLHQYKSIILPATQATWLIHSQEVINYCEAVYEDELNAVTKADSLVANPKYSLIEFVSEYGLASLSYMMKLFHYQR